MCRDLSEISQVECFRVLKGQCCKIEFGGHLAGFRLEMSMKTVLKYLITFHILTLTSATQLLHRISTAMQGVPKKESNF